MWHPRKLNNFGVGVDPIHDNFFVQDNAQLAESLVRETLQNSLDAKRQELDSVSVRFSVKTIKSHHQNVMGLLLRDIMPHLKSAKPALYDSVKNYGEAKVLVIEDFGTTGLEGNESTRQDDNNDFANFWRFVGRTEKGGGRGGSFGIGKVVIPMSSLACTFFGVTVREDSKNSLGPLFMGQSMLPQHKINGTNFEPFILYGDLGDDIVLPVSDLLRIEEFSSCLDFTRKPNQPGTSIAIPYPAKLISCESILNAVVKHYFYSIIKGQLVVEIEGDNFPAVKLTRQSIKEHAKSVGIDFINLLSFVEMSVDVPYNTLLQLPYCPDDLTINAEMFEGDLGLLEDLRKKYENEELLSFKYTLPLAPVKGGKYCGDLHLFIKKSPNVERGSDIYMRSGISVYANSVFKESNKAFALLVADEELICELLRLSEGPAHNTWIFSSAKASAAYVGAAKTIKAAKNSLRELYSLVAIGKEEQDLSSFAKFFPSSRRDEVVDPDSDVSMFNIRATDGVVTVTKRQSANNSTFVGLIGNFSANYVSPPGTKKYSKVDFDLTKRPPMSIKAVGALFHDVKGNKFNFKIEAEDFEITIKTFDKLRDLEIRVNLNS